MTLKSSRVRADFSLSTDSNRRHGAFGSEFALEVFGARDLILVDGQSCIFDVVLGPDFPVTPPQASRRRPYITCL